MLKILVVEDDRFLMSAYRVKLTKVGFEILTASDGNEAMAILQKNVPDIILLDLIMPIKDGFAVLKEVREDENLQNVPVIVASNLGQKEDLDRATQLGADDYIIKSDLSLDDLVTKIKQLAKKTSKK